MPPSVQGLFMGVTILLLCLLLFSTLAFAAAEGEAPSVENLINLLEDLKEEQKSCLSAIFSADDELPSCPLTEQDLSGIQQKMHNFASILSLFEEGGFIHQKLKQKIEQRKEKVINCILHHDSSMDSQPANTSILPLYKEIDFLTLSLTEPLPEEDKVTEPSHTVESVNWFKEILLDLTLAESNEKLQERLFIYSNLQLQPGDEYIYNIGGEGVFNLTQEYSKSFIKIFFNGQTDEDNLEKQAETNCIKEAEKNSFDILKPSMDKISKLTKINKDLEQELPEISNTSDQLTAPWLDSFLKFQIKALNEIKSRIKNLENAHKEIQNTNTQTPSNLLKDLQPINNLASQTIPETELQEDCIGNKGAQNDALKEQFKLKPWQIVLMAVCSISTLIICSYFLYFKKYEDPTLPPKP